MRCGAALFRAAIDTVEGGTTVPNEKSVEMERQRRSRVARSQTRDPMGRFVTPEELERDRKGAEVSRVEESQTGREG